MYFFKYYSFIVIIICNDAIPQWYTQWMCLQWYTQWMCLCWHV